MNTDKPRDELTAEANQVRAELVETVEKLDRIRRNPPLALERPIHDLVRWGAVGGVAFAAAGSVALVLRRREQTIERVRRDRLRLLREAWTHPAQILGARQPPFIVRLAQSLALALATSAFRALSKRWAARLTATRTSTPA